MLKSKGLPTSGRKAELQARLNNSTPIKKNCRGGTEGENTIVPQTNKKQKLDPRYAYSPFLFLCTV